MNAKNFIHGRGDVRFFVPFGNLCPGSIHFTTDCTLVENFLVFFEFIRLFCENTKPWTLLTNSIEGISLAGVNHWIMVEILQKDRLRESRDVMGAGAFVSMTARADFEVEWAVHLRIENLDSLNQQPCFS